MSARVACHPVIAKYLSKKNTLLTKKCSNVLGINVLGFIVSEVTNVTPIASMTQQTRESRFSSPASESKLIIISGCYPSLSETFISSEIALLRKNGLGLSTASLSPAELPGSADIEIFATNSIASNPFLIPRCIRTRLLMLMPRPRQFVALMRRIRAITQLAEKLTPRDHIHAHFAFLPADAASLLGAISGASWSLSLHAADIFTQPPRTLQKRLKGARFITSCTDMGVKYIGVISPESNVALVRHGVSIPQESTCPGDPPRIMAAGRLVAKKGFDTLISACALLPSDLKYSCKIIGDGPLREALERQIDRLGLSHRVSITGAMPHTEVLKRLRKASLFALPSRKLRNGDRDGVANVLLEAMAAGLPVVTTEAGAAAEAVINEETGVLTQPDNPEELAETIESLLTNKDLSQKLGDAARDKMIREFNPQNCITPLINLLQGYTA